MDGGIDGVGVHCGFWRVRMIVRVDTLGQVEGIMKSKNMKHKFSHRDQFTIFKLLQFIEAAKAM